MNKELSALEKKFREMQIAPDGFFPTFENGYKLAKQESEQEAISFAEWIFHNGHIDITQGCIHPDKSFEELYNLFEQSQK